LRKSVPVCITCDIDPTPEANLADKRSALEQTCGLFQNMGIPATFFMVGDLADSYRKQLAGLVSSGHEIGCHGLTHAESEEYGIMDEEQIRMHIKNATELISTASGAEVLSFRGPRVKTSALTQRILEEYGYIADSSVCPQRIDFFSSNLINPAWITAPRGAYHPSSKSAFRKGTGRITVVPVSALMLPFISGSLYIFGLGFMKAFFRLLYEEAQRTGKPIVYILHPSEFAPQKMKVTYSSSLKNILARGFYFRRRFKLRISEEKRFELTESLLGFIAAFPHVQFMTVADFVKKKMV